MDSPSCGLQTGLLRGTWDLSSKERESQSISHSVVSDCLWPHGHQAPLPMGFSRQEYWSESPFPSPGDLPDPGIEPRPPALQADSLLSEPPGKPLSSPKQVSESHSVVSDSLRPRGLYSPWNSLGQNTGMGCLSLLQGIFPTQWLNPSLPRCRQILYHLSYQGSPISIIFTVNCSYSCIYRGTKRMLELDTEVSKIL